ncbi:MAG: ROK family protein [Pyrinomonadaceae bacterium]
MVDSPNRSAIRVGIEISSTSLNAVAIDVGDEVKRTHSVVHDEGGDVVGQVTALVNEFKKEFGEFHRLGIAIPGLVDRKSGRVAFSAIIPAQSDVDLGMQIESATGLNVVIENDANAAAFGEYCCGAGRGSSNMFYATLGEGVGGSFIFGGKTWYGASGFAGEFGYVPINSEGMKLEDVASSANIVRRTQARFHQDSTSSLGKLTAEDLTLGDIISAAQSKDDFAQMMLERTGIYVGTAVASVINLLNVELIVLGGAIMQARQLVLKAVIERARELSFEPSFASTKIVEGELGTNAAAIGAASLGGFGAD